MNDPRHLDPEELIQREVDRAVAPYVGIAPPFMLAKMRELAERYWRENPTAVRVIQMKTSAERARSGTEPTGLAEPDAETDQGAKGGER